MSLHLNIDCLAFIVALRGNLASPDADLRTKIYNALKKSPGFRPLTSAELTEETTRAFDMLTSDGALVEDWDKRAGAL